MGYPVRKCHVSGVSQHLAAVGQCVLVLVVWTRAEAHSDGIDVVPFDGPIVLHHDDGKGSTSAGDTTGPPYEVENLELMSHLALDQLGAEGTSIRANDIWGWVDAGTESEPGSGREYAIVGLSNQTSFVDITDPFNPVHVGSLPTHTGNTSWRDMKVYRDHVYVVSDSNGAHGMQVFDLRQLPEHSGPPATFEETAHYDGFTTAHNIAINEETGFAYAVGTNTFSGGLHTIDLSDPGVPVAAGGYDGDGYTHDTQVVVYRGPDSDHAGREVAFSSNEDTITIVDVTDKASPAMLSREGYAGIEPLGYVHQAWLTEDHRYLLSNDELDELRFPSVRNSRTHIWDVQDLDNPVYLGVYESPATTIDHNIYVKGETAYSANYTAGLRVVDISGIATGDLVEVGHIDTYPTSNSVSFNGAWSVYPFFDSGSIVVSDRNEGLFVVSHLPGDANRDGGVSVDDLSILALNLDKPGAWDQGDFTRDGMVTVADLSLLALNFGEGRVDPLVDMSIEEAFAQVGGSIALLPEPAAGGVLLMLTPWLSRRRGGRARR